ncbi:UDP-2,4-diacetamido-2,4,6-trideoxy-beta-L-altropyranose hydrolase [Providencia rettgeri]
MQIVIRADSGFEIGTGHMMRCLTLANALRNNGHDIFFVSKPHTGNIIDKVKQNNFDYATLTINDTPYDDLYHSRWLGSSQMDDAMQTVGIINQCIKKSVDLIIVDHYAIDHRWEEILKQHTKRILVIDDLADRKHNCDYLLDQTFMRTKQDYQSLLPKDCQLMLGSQFALLRPEFIKPLELIQQIRLKSKNQMATHILVMMGGTDPLNVSAKVLDALLLDKENKKITVVLGPTAPHYDSVKAYCEHDKRITIMSDISNVAELMLNHDICIGAAGTTSLERCSMGLPSILVAFAENQIPILTMLGNFGAVIVFTLEDSHEQILSKLNYLRTPENYQRMTERCLEVCDGKGVKKVINILTT